MNNFINSIEILDVGLFSMFILNVHNIIRHKKAQLIFAYSLTRNSLDM